MESTYIELLIRMSVVVIILSFLATLIFWIDNMKLRKRLTETNNFEEFKEKMNMRVLKKLIKSNKTNAEIINDLILQFEKAKRRLSKWGRMVQLYLLLYYIPIFGGYSLSVFRYYVFLKTGYVFPIRFPLVELMGLVIISVILNVSFWNKIGTSRINMIYQKLIELKQNIGTINELG